MTDCDKYFCHKCRTFVDKYKKGRRVCEDCSKEEHDKYYANVYKNILKGKYVPSGKPRGRPKKVIINDENKQ